MDRQFAGDSHLLLYSAIAEAEFIGDDYVGTQHLVLALLACPGAIDEEPLFRSSASYQRALVTLLEMKANWHADEGRIDRALDICDTLLVGPTASVLNLKAWLLSVSADSRFHRPAEALELARQACELTGHKTPAYLDTLAACHAANGNFIEAVQFAELAAKGAAGSKRPACEARLQLFRIGKAYREPSVDRFDS